MTHHHIIKLDHLIPGFRSLDETTQLSVIQELQEIPQLKAWFEETEPFYDSPTFALRQIQKKRRDETNQKIKEIIRQQAIYDTLKSKIYEVNLKSIGLNWETLIKPEQQTILQTTYSKLPIPQDWFKQFLSDNSKPISAIHKKIKKNYMKEFGFLFKTNDLRSLFKIQQQIHHLDLAEKNALIIELLNQDWGVSSYRIQDSISSVSSYVNDYFKPWFYPVKKYMDEMLSAHVFYRFFGISSDHMVLGNSLESPGLPFVNVFDYYNYHVNRKSIHAAMNVWQALFKPLRPFFHEYVELAQSEKNLIMICIRAFMPFFIMSMVLSLGYAAILPLAYHQLLEYIFFIPSFYFSIVIASQYIQIKNYLYLNFIQWYFGSVYATSTFEPSPNLIEGMKSRELAQEIARYYVSSLEQCDKIEKCYHQLSQTLNNKQIINRKQNSELKSTLLDEWNDFRTSAIDAEQVSRIVQKRLLMDKESTQKTITQLYSIYFNIPEDHKAAFRHEYIYLKNKLKQINVLESQLSNASEKQDSLEDQEERYFEKLSTMV